MNSRPPGMADLAQCLIKCLIKCGMLCWLLAGSGCAADSQLSPPPLPSLPPVSMTQPQPVATAQQLASLQRAVSRLVTAAGESAQQQLAPQLQRQGLQIWATAPDGEQRQLARMRLHELGLLPLLPGWNPRFNSSRLAPPRLPSAPVAQRLDEQSLLAASGPRVVHFWARWCRPCVTELPQLLEFYRNEYLQLRTAGLQIVAVNNDPFSAAPAPPGDAFDLGSMAVLHDPDFSLYRRLVGNRPVALPATFLLLPGGEVRPLAYGRMDWLAPDMAQRLLDQAQRRTLQPIKQEKSAHG